MRSNHKTTTSQTRNNTEKLILVREGIFYGLSIETIKTDKTSLNRGIVSTPNVVFYSNNTKCLIDYTNQTNSDVEEKVNDYFGQMARGMTLTFYNGNYMDVNLNKGADLSGTYKFRSYYNGIVEADVVSTNSLATAINRYDKNRFQTIPYIVAESLLEEVIKNVIKNKFGKNTKNSFNYLGVKPGDYVKITDLESPIKIIDIDVDADGNEYIMVDGNLVETDLTNKKTKVQIFIPVVDQFTVLPSLEETSVGACLEFFNNVIISCTDNHTFSQCRFRSSSLKNIRTELTFGTFCSTPETDTAIQKDNTDNLVQLTTALANVVSNSNTITGPLLQGSNSKNSFYGRSF